MKKTGLSGLYLLVPVRKILFYMKISVLLLLISLQISATNYAQDRINLNLKNATILNVLKSIEKQSVYRFNYSADVVPLEKRINIRAVDASVNYVLNEIFEAYPLVWQVVNNRNIVIAPAPGKNINAPVNWLKKITGTVKNENGQPMADVSITVKGTTTGVSSREDGTYSIEVPDSSTLVFSYVGYQLQEIIDPVSPLNIIMQPLPKSGEEVVVVGFGTQKRTSMVSAVSTIDGDQLSFGGRSLSNNLQGQLPGLISFQRSGEPGYDNATFWIRGISTFGGVQSPLIMVDGVPNRSFNDIDPNEIATFSILKDAAATSVFGAEGANGVILVTTKRGRSQKTQISYRGEASRLTPLRMPEFMNAVDYMEIYNEAVRNTNPSDFMFSQGRIDSTRNRLDPDIYPDVDWVEELIKKHTTNTRHIVDFRGGNEKARFYVSGSYFGESGIFKNNALKQYSSNINLQRYTLRSNIDMDITKTTLLRVDLSGQYTSINFPGVATATIFNKASFTPPHIFPAVYSDGTLADHSDPATSDNRANPYNFLNHSGYTNEMRTNLQSAIILTQKLDAITPGLSVAGNVSFDFNGGFTARSSKAINTFYATGRNPATGNLTFVPRRTGSGEISDGGTTSSASRNIYLEGSLKYARVFNNVHDVTSTFLYFKKESQNQSSGIALITRIPSRKEAFVGRINYTYDKRYSLEFSDSYQGSEQFAEGYRFGHFPAAGAAWIVSNERFYSDGLKSVISNLKFRGSFGLTGNDATGGDRFLYRSTFGGGTGFNLGYDQGAALNAFNGYIEGRFSAPILSWEKEIKRNYGIELGILNNKVNFTLDYFNNFRYDILLQRQTVLGVAGFRQSPYQNFGEVSNKGFDASLTASERFGSHNVSVRGNFSFARNKILERDEALQPYDYYNQKGSRLNMPLIFQADRLFTDDDFDITTSGGQKVYTLKQGIPGQNFSAGLLPGDIKYVDLNNDGVINQFDASRFIGHPTTPEINYGFGVDYAYRGFSFSAYFAGVANTTLIMGSSNAEGFFPFQFGREEASLRAITADRWTVENPSQDVLFPRLRPRSFANNSQASTWWQRSGDFLRLKNAEIGYTLPKNISEKFAMSAARIYLMGFNLLTWDKLKYWDPEQGANNAGVTYPQPRIFTLGVALTLK